MAVPLDWPPDQMEPGVLLVWVAQAPVGNFKQQAVLAALEQREPALMLPAVAAVAHQGLHLGMAALVASEFLD